MTSDALVANPHQVVDHPSYEDFIPERYSIAFFCNMNKDATLEPLKALNEDSANYAPINAHAYITSRLSSTIVSE